MVDRLVRIIRSQTGFCCIGDHRAVVDEHVIPRLIAVRLTVVGHVPFRICFTVTIVSDDDTAVTVTPVTHKLPRRELWNIVAKVCVLEVFVD